MAIYGQATTVTYYAWNTSTNTPVTGDVNNHTVYLVKDGALAAATNAAAEVSGAVFPGLYKVALTAEEMTCWMWELGGKSATANVVLLPKSGSNVYLPLTAPGSATGLALVSNVSAVSTALAAGVTLADGSLSVNKLAPHTMFALDDLSV
jgi:hypothetical protein